MYFNFKLEPAQDHPFGTIGTNNRCIMDRLDHPLSTLVLNTRETPKKYHHPAVASRTSLMSTP